MALRIWQFGFGGGICGGVRRLGERGSLPLTANVVPDGDNFRYTYGVMLTSNSQLIKGDQFAIYDFNGFIDGSAKQPADFSFSTAKVGGNPGRTVPNDNPEMPNLVWTYTGDTPLVGQIGLGNFTALSTQPAASVTTDFVSRTQVEDPNGDIRDEDNITHTKAPAGTDIQPDPTPTPTPTPDPVGPPTGCAGTIVDDPACVRPPVRGRCSISAESAKSRWKRN